MRVLPTSTVGAFPVMTSGLLRGRFARPTESIAFTRTVFSADTTTPDCSIWVALLRHRSGPCSAGPRLVKEVLAWRP